MRATFVLACVAAAVAAAPAAESSSCPATSKEVYTYQGQARRYVTVTEGVDSSLPTETVTQTDYTYTGTTTTTSYETPRVTTCAETATSTVYVKLTATAYIGDFTSSSLRPSTSCAPYRDIVDVYPDGTTTITYTVTQSTAQVTTTVTVEEEKTHWLYRTGTSTSTVSSVSCFETVTSATATAAFTVTQALKCAATNLIGTDGLPGQHYRGAIADGIASYESGGVPAPGVEGRSGAHKDASACCQACQDDANCAASLFAGTLAGGVPWCQLWNQNTPSCGLGFTVFPGDQKMASTGCGYIAENVWWEGVCPEGLSARECETLGYVNGIVQ